MHSALPMTMQRQSQRHSTHSHRSLFSALLVLLACSSALLGVLAHSDGNVFEPGPPFEHCDVFRIRLVSTSGSQDLWIADRGEWGEPLDQGHYLPVGPIRTASPIPPDAVRVEVAFQRASVTVMRSVTTCVVNGGFVQYFRAPSSASPPEDATALPTFAQEIQGLMNGVNSITINTDCSQYFYGTIVIDDGTSGNGNGGGETGTDGTGGNGGGGETGTQDPGTGGETGSASGPSEPQDPQACELSALSFAPFPNNYSFTLSPAFAPGTTSYTGVLPADVFLISMKPELATGTTSAAIITLVVNGATPLVLTAGQDSASIPLGQEIGLTTNTLDLKVTSGAACTKSYQFVFDRVTKLSDGTESTPGQPFFNWAVGSWGPCSASCGPGVTQRSVSCQASDNRFVASFQNCTKEILIDSDHNGIPDDTGSETAGRPESEAACNLAPCSGGLDQPGAGSSTGSDGPVLTTMCARYAQASFGLGGSVTSQTRFVKAILRRALDGCGSNICNPSFPGILGASSPYRTGEATSARAEKLRANADNYKDRFLHKVARLFGRGLACDAQGFPLSEQPGQDDPPNPSADSENELAQCITDLFPTASQTQRITTHRQAVAKGATMHQGAPPGRHAGHAHEDSSTPTRDAIADSSTAGSESAASTSTGAAAPMNSSPTATQSSLSLSNFASTQLLYSLQSYGLSIDDASLAFQRGNVR